MDPETDYRKLNALCLRALEQANFDAQEALKIIKKECSKEEYAQLKKDIAEQLRIPLPTIKH